jgi:hypothetical protein
VVRNKTMYSGRPGEEGVRSMSTGIGSFLLWLAEVALGGVGAAVLHGVWIGVRSLQTEETCDRNTP